MLEAPPGFDGWVFCDLDTLDDLELIGGYVVNIELLSKASRARKYNAL